MRDPFLYRVAVERALGRRLPGRLNRWPHSADNAALLSRAFLWRELQFALVVFIGKSNNLAKGCSYALYRLGFFGFP